MPALTQRSLTSFSQAPRLLVLNEDSYSRPDDELGNQAKPEQCAPPFKPILQCSRRVTGTWIHETCKTPVCVRALNPEWVGGFLRG